jgi:hypothetical protein
MSNSNSNNDPRHSRPDVTVTFDTLAAQLLGVAQRSGAWVRDQARSGLDELVSRFFGLSEKSPEHDKSLDRDTDKGMDR